MIRGSQSNPRATKCWEVIRDVQETLMDGYKRQMEQGLDCVVNLVIFSVEFHLAFKISVTFSIQAL